MTKSELINQVADRISHLTRKDAEIIVDTIFDTMTDFLSRGEGIEIRGFGSFKVKQRRDRQGRNPKTGEQVRIPAKRMPFFKVGKGLKERINKTGSCENDFTPVISDMRGQNKNGDIRVFNWSNRNNLHRSLFC